MHARADLTAAHLVNTVGVADGGDGLGLNNGAVAAAHAADDAAVDAAADAAVAVSRLFVRGRPRMVVRGGPLHRDVDHSGQRALLPPAPQLSQTKWGRLLSVPFQKEICPWL